MALTGPQYGFRWEQIEQKGIDMIVALDCSKSMLAADIKPSRLDRAKREVTDLLHMLKGDRVGLVAFAGTAFLQCPLTVDYEAFHLFLTSLSPDFMPVGGTDIAAALSSAMDGFDPESNSEKAVILITDGENTGEDPFDTVEKAAESGIKIFTIGVGQEGGVPIPGGEEGFKKDASGQIVMTKLDEELLKQMAALTKGAYVRSVAGDMDLEAIYTDEIRGKMEQTTVAGGKKQVWEDRFQWFLIVAIMALMIEIFIPSVKKTVVLSMGIFCCLLMNPYPVFAKNTYGMVREGLNAYENGEYEKALKHFIDAQLEEPDRPEIYYNIGNTYYKMGDYEAAHKNYLSALKTEDKELEQKIRYNLGNTRFRQQALKDAIAQYQASLDIDPDDEKAQQNLEFAKKLLEHQQQQNQSDNDKSDKEEKKEENKAQEDKKNSSNQEKENKQQSRDQQQQNKQDKEEDENQDKSQGEREKENKPSEKPEEKTNSDQQKADLKNRDGEKDPHQAEKMLNRLKDEPGKAMIPSYEPRHIEKDW